MTEQCTITSLWRKSHSHRCAIATTLPNQPVRCSCNRQPLFSKQGKKQGQDDGDQDAGGQGKIEGEILTFDGNITGKPAEPGDLVGKDQDDAKRGHQAAGNDQ